MISFLRREKKIRRYCSRDFLKISNDQHSMSMRWFELLVSVQLPNTLSHNVCHSGLGNYIVYKSLTDQILLADWIGGPWKILNTNKAYSRSVFRSTLQGYPLLRKLCKALFWWKHLEKGLNWWGGSKILGALFFKKSVLS